MLFFLLNITNLCILFVALLSLSFNLKLLNEYEDNICENNEDLTNITTYTFNNVLRNNGFILLFHTIMQDKIPFKISLTNLHQRKECFCVSELLSLSKISP